MKVKKVIVSMFLSTVILFSEVSLSVQAEENLEVQSTEEAAETTSEVADDGENSEAAAPEQSVEALTADALGLSVEYPADIKCGEQVTFKLNATGGSGNYKYRIFGLMDSSLTSVYDVSYGSNGAYGESNEFAFTFYASGTYYIRFSVMDMTTYQTKSTGLYEYPIVIQDENFPSVEQIADTLAVQCEAECSTDFEKALWMHDWIIHHADYDYTYSYCAPEGVLARGTGTCESYHRAYVLLLNKVGIQTGRIEGNGHVWTAVQMDGAWYQVDSTWDDKGDDNKGTYYEHLYFGLTDEIISCVHSDHTAAVPGYESTDLENNYFIKTGEIAQWSNPFVDTVKQNIADGKTEFVIPVTDNMPDSYKNVIYNLVAYQLSKENWDNRELTVSYGDGQLTCRVKANETVSIQNVEIRNMDNGKGTFDVVLEGVSATGVVSDVQVPVWSGSSQDNIYWYTAVKQADGSYIAHVDIKNHKNEYGEYNVHVYVTLESGACKLAGQTKATIEQPSPAVTVLPTASGQYRLTLAGLEASGEIKGVSFAVWGENDGQNDLNCYNAAGNGDGTWSAVLSIAKHGENGVYNVWAYTQNPNGTLTCVVRTVFRHEESASVQSIDIKNMNSNTGTFDVVIKGVTATCGVELVQVPVWSKDDQSDIKWYTAAKQSDGSYAVQVNLKNHDYNYAEYTIHVYVTSKTQVKAFVGAASATVKQPQAKVDAVLSADEKTCSLTAENVAVPGGVKKAYFAVWSENGGQDDLLWYEAEKTAGGIWKKDIYVATHKTEGIYQVHLYGEDNQGKRSVLGAASFEVSRVSVQSIKVKNLNAANGTFDVFISGIEAPSGVEKMQVPVWSQENQSDIRWYTAIKQKDGSYAIQINIRDHNYNYGKYTIHTYMTAGNGVYKFTGSTSTSIYPPRAKAQAALSANEMTCSLTADSVQMAGGVQKVYFAVWSETGGQDDLVWYEAKNTGGGTWKKDISIADHKTDGTYQVHLYGEDMSGKRIVLGTTTFDVSYVMVQSIKVKNVMTKTGTFDVFISGIESPSGVEKVQVPVWSQKDQSDIRWYSAIKQKDGSYAIQINIRDHHYNYGEYTIHVYVTAGNGTYRYTGGTFVTMSAP